MNFTEAAGRADARPFAAGNLRERRGPMDFEQIYHFLFQTYGGIGCMVGAGIAICLIACIIMERRTRKLFVDRPKSKDEWSLFDDDDEDEENSKE